MQARHHLELDGLRSRIRKLQAATESVSFRVGEALVAVGRSPSRVWRLPERLWQIYRSVRPKRSRPKRRSRVSFPPLQIPTPNTSGLPVVAAILDTFSEYCLRFEADLVLLTPNDWREQMERTRPALLLVESAWVGNNRAWHRLIADNWKLSDNPLHDLIEYCRSHRVPSVFWNKEDPPSFETFIDAAKGFDVVLTTDADCIPKYKAACGHDRAYAMPFAAQPKLHNPRQEVDWPRHRVVFAGSWASRRERTKPLSCLLDAALPFGLHIFDRNSNRKDLGSRAAALSFPDRYQQAIRGSLDYSEMLTAYRSYDVLLNTNSVTDSPTMFSRRVFESLGCGTPVVSTESVGMRRLLGDHVRVARDSEEASTHLRALFDDEEARARQSHLAYRHVHENHTYRHRMADIRRWAGLPEQDDTTIAVSMLMVVHDQKRALRAIEDFEGQSHPNKELLLVLHGSSFDLNVIRQRARASTDVQMLNVGNDTTLGGCLNRAAEAASGEYVAILDEDCIYGERYIADMMLAADFADADILGKGTYYVCTDDSGILALRVSGPEHQVTDFVIGSTLTAQRDYLSRFPFEDQSEETRSALVRRASEAGCRIYSTDRFNHVVVETGTPTPGRGVKGTDGSLPTVAHRFGFPQALI
jgi:glycosyltransferase involved in cell wall biosynthesis